MNRGNLTVVTQLPALFLRLPGNISKRWAGHSKWQNIKSTKEAQDRQRAMKFQKIQQKINAAVREDNNAHLRAAMDEAKKAMMPKETLQNMLKNASNKELCEPYWVFYSGLDGAMLGFEVITPNRTIAINSMNHFMKKISFKHEKHVNDYFNVKGLIISESLPDTENSYDKAVEHGIEAGVAEVTEGDSNTIYFECDPEFLKGSSKKLNSLGYNIQSATTEIEFIKFKKVSSDEKKKIDEVIERLQNNYHDIIRIVSNFEDEANNA